MLLKKWPGSPYRGSPHPCDNGLVLWYSVHVQYDIQKGESSVKQWNTHHMIRTQSGRTGWMSDHKYMCNKPRANFLTSQAKY